MRSLRAARADSQPCTASPARAAPEGRELGVCPPRPSLLSFPKKARRPAVSIRQHTSAYVSIRQHTSAYVNIRQHTPAYVSIRQHTSAYVSIRQHTSAYVNIRQHTSAYVSIRQYTSAYVSIASRSRLAGLPREL
jgi:isocitrate/isopropylmalate dehydrogenase